MEGKAGVYRFLNVTTKQSYIGSTGNLRLRRRTHLSLLRNNKHYNTALQNAFNEHGEGAFVFEVLEATTSEPEVLATREQFYIQNDPLAYNVLQIVGGMTGKHPPESSREKMSAAQKRRGGPDAEARAKAAATKAANPIPMQSCFICGTETRSIRKGRCHACDEYRRRKGVERPWPRDPSICKYGHQLESAGARCKICARDATRRCRAKKVSPPRK